METKASEYQAKRGSHKHLPLVETFGVCEASRSRVRPLVPGALKLEKVALKRRRDNLLFKQVIGFACLFLRRHDNISRVDDDDDDDRCLLRVVRSPSRCGAGENNNNNSSRFISVSRPAGDSGANITPFIRPPSLIIISISLLHSHQPRSAGHQFLMSRNRQLLQIGMKLHKTTTTTTGCC